MTSRFRDLLLRMVHRLPLFLAILLGIFLRTYQITLQIPADDEWHTLHALMTGRLIDIVTHLGVADYSIPMTALFRIVYVLFGLSEMIIRLPVLIAGIAFLAVGPWMVRVWLGRSTSVAFAWLLAVSPLLIFYSRYARPYMISTFLCFIAAFAFFDWWRGGKVRWKWLYLGCAVLAPCFHLSTLPFVTAPLGFGLAELLTGKPDDSRSLKDLVRVSVLLLLGFLLLLAPPFLNDQTAWAGKVAHQRIELETLTGSAQLFVGTPSFPVIAISILLALVGIICLLSRYRRLCLYLLFLILGQIGGSSLIGPSGWQVPIVFVRYSLSCLPIVILFVSVAISSAESRARRVLPLPKGWLALFWGGILLITGPLTQIYSYPNNWTNHGLFQYCYDSMNRSLHYRFITKPDTISEFYRELRNEAPGSLILLEAPWYYAWHLNPFPHFQRVHRQKMMVGFVDDPESWDRAGEYPPSMNRMRFRSFVHLSEQNVFPGRMIDFVVLHKDLSSEVPNSAAREKVDMTDWVSRYRSIFGRPHFEDSTIVVFKTNQKN